MQRVKIPKDSLHPNKRNRFTTFIIDFPKCLLAELNTHRQLVRNVGSSRAVPVKKMIERVLDNPFIPIFSSNQPGMVGKDTLTSEHKMYATDVWYQAMDNAVKAAEQFIKLNIHKEAANRVLEPFLSVELVLSGTDFEHFFELRNNENAQKSFRDIAAEMEELYRNNKPDELKYGDWHIPFDEFFPDGSSLTDKLKIAVARCARVSYQSHSKDHTTEKDFELYDRLWSDKHLSPFEHVAKAVDNESDNTVWFYDNHVDIRDYLPDKLQDYLFFDEYQNKFKWTRQYAGFYTLRSHIEDGAGLT